MAMRSNDKEGSDRIQGKNIWNIIYGFRFNCFLLVNFSEQFWAKEELGTDWITSWNERGWVKLTVSFNFLIFVLINGSRAGVLFWQLSFHFLYLNISSFRISSFYFEKQFKNCDSILEQTIEHTPDGSFFPSFFRFWPFRRLAPISPPFLPPLFPVQCIENFPTGRWEHLSFPHHLLRKKFFLSFWSEWKGENSFITLESWGMIFRNGKTGMFERTNWIRKEFYLETGSFFNLNFFQET